jgi:hypothetical protein
MEYRQNNENADDSEFITCEFGSLTVFYRARDH